MRSFRFAASLYGLVCVCDMSSENIDTVKCDVTVNQTKLEWKQPMLSALTGVCWIYSTVQVSYCIALERLWTWVADDIGSLFSFYFPLIKKKMTSQLIFNLNVREYVGEIPVHVAFLATLLKYWQPVPTMCASAQSLSLISVIMKTVLVYGRLWNYVCD